MSAVSEIDPAVRSQKRGAPGRMQRFVFRTPLWLERVGLTALTRLATQLVGIDWIVLDTIGRRSGQPHSVVLDVVGRDERRDAYYVQPAYGRDAQWVRNVTAHPDVTARIGDRAVRARVRDATGTEGAEVVLHFIRTHPRYARVIVWFVGYVDSVDRSDAELREMLASTPVFAVEVRE